MEEPESTSVEEDEAGVEVRQQFECDLGVCGGRHNVDHVHTPECLASTSGREMAERMDNSNQRALLSGETPSQRLAEVDGVSDRVPQKLGCSSKFGGRSRSSAKDDGGGRGTSKRDKNELGRQFQLAVSTHDWLLAESYIPMADGPRLNDGLCIALDSVWFLSTTEELAAARRLIEKLIQAGASDFTRAALRTSFLASCVSACRSRTMSLADTVTVMAQR